MIEEKKRLRWCCRRGMWELDQLLGHFLEHEFERLDADQRKLFVTLLDQSDQDLFDWLVYRRTCPHGDYTALIQSIIDAKIRA